MAVIGSLAVNIIAKMNPFAKGMQSARREVDKFRRDVMMMGATLSRFAGVALGVGGIYGLGRMALGTVNAIDELDELSTRVGISVGSLQKLQYAANLSGVSADTLTRSIERMNKSIGIAVEKPGAERGIFRELGLSAQKLANMAPEKAFIKIADALRTVQPISERTRLSMGLLGKSAGQLAALMADGGGKMKIMMDEFERLHGTPSEEQIGRVVEFADSIDRVKASFSGLRQQAVIAGAGPAATFMDNLSTTLQAMNVAVPKWLTGKSNPLSDFMRGANFLMTGRNESASGGDVLKAVADPIKAEWQKTIDIVNLAAPQIRNTFLAIEDATAKAVGKTGGFLNWLLFAPKANPISRADVGKMFGTAGNAMAGALGIGTQQLRGQEDPLKRDLQTLINVLLKQLDLDRAAFEMQRQQRQIPPVVLEPSGIN